MPSTLAETRGFALPPLAPTPSPAAALIRAAEVSASVSRFEFTVRPRSSPDQLDTPCCVSCALGGAMEIVHPDWPALAPLFHYFVTRFINNGADSNGFLDLGAAMVTLVSQGICRQADHDAPFTEAGIAARPSPDAFADALQRRIPKVGRLFQFRPLSGPSWVVSIRQELQQSRPVVIGFVLPQRYPDGFLDAQGEWTDSSAPSANGHCVLVTGYDDTRQALHIRDSQGVQRFDNGSWWMSYRVADGVIQDGRSLLP